MGRGIAQVASQAGHRVLLADIDLATAARSHETIVKGLDKLVGKGKISEADRNAIAERIVAVDGIGGLAPAQIAVEAATENEALKLQLFKQMDEALGTDGILASNTSTSMRLLR